MGSLRRPTRAGVVRVSISALALLAISCGTKSDVVNVDTGAGGQGGPPFIVAQGPNWPSTPIDQNVQAFPSPYVIAADPDGLDDIALAVFTFDTAVLRRIIVRPDSLVPQSSCTTVAWSDSIDITPMLPASFGPSPHCAMSRDGSMFSANVFYWSPGSGGGCQAFPLIAAASPHFGPPTSSCGPQYALSRFGIYPPGVPAPVDVNVTFAEVEFRGLSATVHDGAGNTATANFPPLRLVYRMFGEGRTPTRGDRAGAPVASLGRSGKVARP